jgi:segregation and condensation protein A
VMDRDAVFTMEQALERMRGLIGYAGDWGDLMSFLPEGWESDPVRRRSATAATFAASLELVKEGHMEIRQSEVFGAIQLRKRDEDHGSRD